MSYFNIVPRNKKYLNKNIGSIPLNLLVNDGVNYSPNLNIKITNLNEGNQHYKNNTSKGGKFKIKILINKNDKVNNTNFKVTEVLDWIMVTMTPVMISTDAIDINTKNLYIITDNPSRKQIYPNTTTWELEFATYTPLTLGKFKNDNITIKKAIKKYKNRNKSSKRAGAKYNKLKSCNYKVLKYSKKKKVVDCVRILQEVLYRNKIQGFTKKDIDGWYGKKTKEAVKKYQQNYNKKYKKTNKTNSKTSKIIVNSGKLISGNKTKTTKQTNKISKKLKVTGKVDKATWMALYMGE